MPATFSFTSGDGTVLRGWRNEGPGVPLVISNGLGTVPSAWPALVSASSGYDACTWHHRGTFGSARPADPSRIRVEDHADDLLALMDHLGIERALVVGWSIGVNVAFEMAQRHPDRVAGLMAVAGVPGGTFATMGGPLRIPRAWRRTFSTGVARVARLAGPGLNLVTPRLPVNRHTAWLLAHSGFLRPSARPEVLAPMLAEFLGNDWRWYFGLAVAAAEHHPMELGWLRCPVTLVAGQHDILTSMHDVTAAASRIPHAQVTVLPGSHFLPLEYPELLQAALGELARRSSLDPR
ncbi:MAG: alpha/beta hydrolase [Actinomycetota bacterium]|nr:alpha/beta hydrolase [Actinomycetota bacterium]